MRHLPETFIIQAFTDALLHPVENISCETTVVGIIGTRHYHRPTGYKPRINDFRRVDLSPKPGSSYIRWSGGNDRGSGGSPHEPVVYYRSPDLVESLVSTSRWREHSLKSHTEVIRSHTVSPHQAMHPISM